MSLRLQQRLAAVLSMTPQGQPDYDFVIEGDDGEFTVYAYDGPIQAGYIVVIDVEHPIVGRGPVEDPWDLGPKEMIALIEVDPEYRLTGTPLGTLLFEEAKGYSASRGFTLIHDSKLSSDAQAWIAKLPRPQYGLINNPVSGGVKVIRL